MNNTQSPQQVVYIAQGKSRFTYILLAFLFGGLGLHDFYAGYTGKGLMKILNGFLSGFLMVMGGLGTFVFAATEEAEAAGSMGVTLLLGIGLLLFQGLYIFYQMFAVNKDAKGVPFS